MTCDLCCTNCVHVNRAHFMPTDRGGLPYAKSYLIIVVLTYIVIQSYNDRTCLKMTF